MTRNNSTIAVIETRSQGMAEALYCRVDPRAVESAVARDYRAMSLLELGREFLDMHGVQTRALDRMELARALLTTRTTSMQVTGDFSSLVANVANKRLRQAYEENPGTYTQWARRAPDAKDFKTINVVQLSGAPDLLQTSEHGEFKYGNMSDGGEFYAVITYGRVVALTRQAMVNDDLRSFDRMVFAFGAAARRLENRLVYSQLTANGNMSDGTALFNANALSGGGHANLLSGGTSPLQSSSLATARTGMRLQRGYQAEELNLSPRFLIVPAALEQTAYQLTSNQYAPATNSAVNEFRQGGRTELVPIVEPVLDGISSTAFYLAADSRNVDTVEYCYLDGADGPVIETKVGFDIDGISMRCRLDFAAKAIDWRGLYKSSGS